MTTTESQPTKRDQTWADTNCVPVGDPAPPRQGAAHPERLRWWRADPEDWMRWDACRPRPTIPGASKDGG